MKMILPDCPQSLVSNDAPRVNWAAALDAGLRTLADRDLQRLHEVLVSLLEPPTQTRH